MQHRVQALARMYDFNCHLIIIAALLERFIPVIWSTVGDNGAAIDLSMSLFISSVSLQSYKF